MATALPFHFAPWNQRTAYVANCRELLLQRPSGALHPQSVTLRPPSVTLPLKALAFRATRNREQLTHTSDTKIPIPQPPPFLTLRRAVAMQSASALNKQSSLLEKEPRKTDAWGKQSAIAAAVHLRHSLGALDHRVQRQKEIGVQQRFAVVVGHVQRRLVRVVPRVHLRVRRQQRRHDLRGAVLGPDVQRGVAGRVPGVHLGPSVHKQLDLFREAQPRSGVQRRAPVGVWDIDLKRIGAGTGKWGTDIIHGVTTSHAPRTAPPNGPQPQCPTGCRPRHSSMQDRTHSSPLGLEIGVGLGTAGAGAGAGLGLHSEMWGWGGGYAIG